MPTNLAVVQPADLGPEFDIGNVTSNKITVLAATTTNLGKIRLASTSDYSAGTVGAAVDTAGLKNALSGYTNGISYQGLWNPATNASPQLLSGIGTKGYLYKLASNGVSNTTNNTAAVSNSTSIPVSSTTGLVVGQQITGTNIPASPVVTIASISGSTITASIAVTLSSGTSLTFATYLDGAGPFYANDTVLFDGTTYDKLDGPAESVTPASVTAQASVQLTNSFGVAIAHAFP